MLHIDSLDADPWPGLTLTTRTSTGAEGLSVVTPLGALPLPIDQTFRVWAADAPNAPRDITDGDAKIGEIHEMWVSGRQFLSMDYAGWRTERRSGLQR